jgi:predicted transcriptional regulator
VDAIIKALAASGGPGLALAVILLVAVPSVAYLIKFLVDAINREATRADGLRSDLRDLTKGVNQIASSVETLRSALELVRQEAKELRGNQDRIMDRVDRQIDRLSSEIQGLGHSR